MEEKKENKKRSKFIRILLVLKKKIKLRMVFFLALTITANTFAWFIYANKVEGGINARVKAWNVLFEVNEGEQVQYIDFDVASIYPGMETYSHSLRVTNKGESYAKLSYEVMSANILGDYIEADKDSTITPELLLYSLRTDYPFKINPTFDKFDLAPGEVGTFTLVVSWPYESGDDEADTFWGSKAYDFHAENPDESSMRITLKIMATQVAES